MSGACRAHQPLPALPAGLWHCWSSTIRAAPLQALDKINAQVQAGNYYEAQQMYKTVYYRYRSRKQAMEAYQILKVCTASRRLKCTG